ncbi:type VII secretion-associated serine protease mycosin [Streptomyces sp. TLI_146]|uniref:type VII secretion-associated serine protease mycosin n=1 Tax=Streptomyces sp. TLI_146 TaxID=1938858 RepID=UPI000C7040D8|nr:type VII secretion-associated serine protease mycosin [Streptomyces sp. TLI_146]PKV88292.1 type VII secretion-associated serine protease mycosin [Streptomyces sp. TLI_146]
MFSSARSVRSRSALLGAAVAAALACSVGTAPAALADDMRSKQWYLDAMDADAMWKVSTGRGITVAVIDSGVRSEPELAGRVLEGRDFTGSGGSLKDADGHGTDMAVTISGSGTGGGVKGLAPDAKILSVRAAVGNNEFGAMLTLAKAIRYTAETDARVINISRAGNAPGEREKQELASAVDYALSKGKLIFAGSGNGGDKGNPVEYPAATPGVVAVGSVGTDGKLSKFSSTGSHVGLAAPGDKIPAHCSDGNGYCEARGTSYATALTSATAALIWSAHPNWTGNQVLRVMMETAGHNGKVPSQYIGYGTVRPAQVLLKGNGNPGPADVNPLLAARGGAAATTSPSPADTADKGAGGGDQEKPQAGEAADSASEDKDSAPWTVIAIIAAAVVLIGGAVTAVRVRNKRA